MFMVCVHVYTHVFMFVGTRVLGAYKCLLVKVILSFLLIEKL